MGFEGRGAGVGLDMGLDSGDGGVVSTVTTSWLVLLRHG